MNQRDWIPHVTVAAVVEKDRQFLLVEENASNGIVINQPAGHWERGETLEQAVIRETLEETGWSFIPERLIGVYQWTNSDSEQTYLRFAFAGAVDQHFPEHKLDKEIIRTLWWSEQQIKSNQHRLRSPQVIRCLDDYLDGLGTSLELLKLIDD